MNQLLELSTVGIQVLTIISCMEVETSDDCEKLRTTNDSYQYLARSLIPFQPLMLSELNKAMLDHDGERNKMLPAVQKLIREFDLQIENSGVESKEKAMKFSMKHQPGVQQHLRKKEVTDR